ncbi:MAG: hypothetical protein EOO05_20130 [Chitinophagaceae bacterium]|nr:MAG: hypothetical protein EOO05_20130 [Chitinophagaceae bacterium]
MKPNTIRHPLQALFPLFLLLTFLLTACDKNDVKDRPSYDVVYLQSNNFNDNQNAVIAYRTMSDGTLEMLPGSPFLTGGSGVGNPMQILGPLDSDYELRFSSDKKFLLAVNSGSNTIAVFTIMSDGQLQPVAGSPFPSGGQTPVSIDITGNQVFVANKSQDPLHATPMLPNYSSFTIDGNGKLTAASGKQETVAGSSPSNALLSRDGKYLFATDFLSFMLDAPKGTLRSYSIGTGSSLTPVSGTPYILPAGAMPDNGALGLWQHPSGNPLYVGLPVQGKVGVFNIDASTGALSMQTSVAAGPAACWLRTNNSGDKLYVLNSAANTVQVYNTSNPSSPSSMQVIELKMSGPEYPGPGTAMFKTSQDFSLHLSPDEKTLYVLCQHTNTDFSIGNYNYLHSLKVNADGTLVEETEPVQLPVASNIRPKGLAVITRK